jgi:VWFA-related protein
LFVLRLGACGRSRVALLALIMMLTLPAHAAKQMSVGQLERMLATAHGKADAKIAQQLSTLELTERLSPPSLLRLESQMPGAESRRALVVLADVSAFLNPPASEIPAAATPDLSTQRQILAKAVDYATNSIRHLPNFFATRDTIHFEDSPSGQRPDASAIPYVPMHAVGRTSATVHYRDGHEIVNSSLRNHAMPSHGLITSGVFGPILGTVLVDVPHGNLVWSHWEQGSSGPQAVFRFHIPKEKSHYEVEFCCVAGDTENGVFKQFSGYHGEIAVDPLSGAIYRLTLKADLKKSDALVRSDILVEYGPVKIGGNTYTVPLKSISITLAPAFVPGMQRFRGELLDPDPWAAREHLQTMLNDVAFEQYHVFRSDARIVSGDHSEPAANAGISESAGATSEEPPVKDIANPAADKGPPAVPTDNPSSATPAVSATGSTTPAPPSATPSPAPEISVADESSLPDSSLPAKTPSHAGAFTLHVTTRLVDVSVVALDKKGHPITNLKPEDFKVYDNERKQEVRFFSRAEAEFTTQPAEAPQPQGATPEQLVYSNRRADIADAKAGTTATESTVTVLAIDASNLAWADLSFARGQILQFLQKLPPGEPVGLYVQSSRGFRVLAERTADHGLLVSKLSQWMPSAQELARAQQEEQRNRQQFDWVEHNEDLKYVNGNKTSEPETATPIDPQLRDFGANPGRQALSILIGMAGHLASIPGHKNLVWITSDNVLADWTDKAVSTDKGSKHLEDFALRAQEALNDAQVSIYPLDASQLETMAIDPGLQNSEIKLAPGAPTFPQPKGSSTPMPVQQDTGTGRTMAELQQDVHPIQASIQAISEATGGRVFPRSGNIAINLNSVVADGHATYLLGFSPDTAADDQYHLLKVKVSKRHGMILRYRTGYLYSKEPATLKERFMQAIWQPLDVSEIAVTAHATPVFTGATLKLNIAINDLGLRLGGARWLDKLDVFVVHREDDGRHARVAGRTLVLALQPTTYQSLLENGIPFDQFIEKTENTGSIRIVVVDENSGRIGTVTLPTSILQGKPSS